MKVIPITLYVQDEELEERIVELEERCKEINISLQQIFEIVYPTMPYKPYVDILLSYSDLKIDDMEREQRMKHFFDKFKR